MKLVVGLGNPGRRYANTRHNVGYEVLVGTARWLSRVNSTEYRAKSKFDSEVIESQWGHEKVVLLSPVTYMNLSGRAVQPAASFFQVDLSDILVICDDFHLELGRLRLRRRGSAGGQKGLEDIIQRMASDHFPRLRVGIGPVPPQRDVSKFVLSKFTAIERQEMDQAVERAVAAVGCWIEHGIEVAMNRFNSSRPEGPSAGGD